MHRWKELSRRYRQYLFCKGSVGSPGKGAAFELARAQQVVIQQQGQLSLAERLRCRIRYFSDGVILGSQGFVEAHFHSLQQKLAYKRPRAATPLRALGSPNLWVFRDLRIYGFSRTTPRKKGPSGSRSQELREVGILRLLASVCLAANHV